MSAIHEKRQVSLIQIRSVNLLREVGAQTEVEIRLSLNPSRTTAIRKWRLELTVCYADGSKYQVITGEARQPDKRLVYLVPTRSGESRGSGLIGYEAKLVISFNTISSIIIHKEFVLPCAHDKSGERFGAIGKGRMAILDACQVKDSGSLQGEARNIDVRWMAEAPPQAVINRFDLEVKATYADGTIRRICKTVSGAQRQARLSLAAPDSEIVSIKARLGATFTWSGSETAAKFGNFSA